MIQPVKYKYTIIPADLKSYSLWFDLCEHGRISASSHIVGEPRQDSGLRSRHPFGRCDQVPAPRELATIRPVWSDHPVMTVLLVCSRRPKTSCVSPFNDIHEPHTTVHWGCGHTARAIAVYEIAMSSESSLPLLQEPQVMLSER